MGKTVMAIVSSHNQNVLKVITQDESVYHITKESYLKVADTGKEELTIDDYEVVDAYWKPIKN